LRHEPEPALAGQIHELPAPVRAIASGPFGVALQYLDDSGLHVLDPDSGRIRLTLTPEDPDFRWAAGGWTAVVYEGMSDSLSCYDLATGALLGGGFNPSSQAIEQVLMGSGNDAQAMLISKQEGRTRATLMDLPQLVTTHASVLPDLPDCGHWFWHADAGLTRVSITHPRHGECLSYEWADQAQWQRCDAVPPWGQVALEKRHSILPTAVADWQVGVDAEGLLSWHRPAQVHPLGQLPQWSGMRLEGGALSDARRPALVDCLHLDPRSGQLLALAPDGGFLIRHALQPRLPAIAMPRRCRYRPGQAWSLPLHGSPELRWSVHGGPAGMHIASDRLHWPEPAALGTTSVELQAVDAQGKQLTQTLTLLAGDHAALPQRALQAGGYSLCGIGLRRELGGPSTGSSAGLRCIITASDGHGGLRFRRRPDAALGLDAALEQAYRYACSQTPALRHMQVVVDYANQDDIHDASALSATAAVILRTLCQGLPLQDGRTVLGRVAPDGSLLAIDHIAAHLVAARQGGVHTVVVPSACRATVTDLLLLGHVDLVEHLQILVADNVDEATRLISAGSESAIGQAMARYQALRARLRTRPDAASLPADLQTVLAACPAHLSAALALQRRQGKAPTLLSPETSRLLVARALLPFAQSLLSRQELSRELQDRSIARMHEEFGELYPMLEPQAERFAIAARDWLRAAHRRVQMQQEIASSVDAARRARLQHQLEPEQTRQRAASLHLDEALAAMEQNLPELFAQARR
ncbi:MAG: hypothetical protein ACOCXJ_02905, partial [Planctomycetota bacterium]